MRLVISQSEFIFPLRLSLHHFHHGAFFQQFVSRDASRSLKRIQQILGRLNAARLQEAIATTPSGAKNTPSFIPLWQGIANRCIKKRHISPLTSLLLLSFGFTLAGMDTLHDFVPLPILRIGFQSQFDTGLLFGFSLPTAGLCLLTSPLSNLLPIGVSGAKVPPSAIALLIHIWNLPVKFGLKLKHPSPFTLIQHLLRTFLQYLKSVLRAAVLVVGPSMLNVFGCPNIAIAGWRGDHVYAASHDNLLTRFFGFFGRISDRLNELLKGASVDAKEIRYFFNGNSRNRDALLPIPDSTFGDAKPRSDIHSSKLPFFSELLHIHNLLTYLHYKATAKDWQARLTCLTSANDTRFNRGMEGRQSSHTPKLISVVSLSQGMTNADGNRKPNRKGNG